MLRTVLNCVFEMNSFHYQQKVFRLKIFFSLSRGHLTHDYYFSIYFSCRWKIKIARNEVERKFTILLSFVGFDYFVYDLVFRTKWWFWFFIFELLTFCLHLFNVNDISFVNTEYSGTVHLTKWKRIFFRCRHCQFFHLLGSIWILKPSDASFLFFLVDSFIFTSKSFGCEWFAGLSKYFCGISYFVWAGCWYI